MLTSSVYEIVAQYSSETKTILVWPNWIHTLQKILVYYTNIDHSLEVEDLWDWFAKCGTPAYLLLLLKHELNWTLTKMSRLMNEQTKPLFPYHTTDSEKTLSLLLRTNFMFQNYHKFFLYYLLQLQILIYKYIALIFKYVITAYYCVCMCAIYIIYKTIFTAPFPDVLKL